MAFIASLKEIFKKMDKEIPEEGYLKLDKKLSSINLDEPNGVALVIAEVAIILTEYFHEEASKIAACFIKEYKMSGYYYVVDVNFPRLHYTKEDAEEAVRSIKHHSLEYEGRFTLICNHFFYYEFNHTIPASEAKAVDYPKVYYIPTDKILPQIERDYVDIDVDVGVVSKKKMRLIVQEQQQQIQALQQALELGLEPAAAKRVLQGLPTVQPSTENIVQAIQAPILETPNIQFTAPNEDSISASVKDQLMGFLKEYPNLSVTANRARTEGSPRIIVITRYAKSRPDTMILKSVVVSSTGEEEEEEGEEEEEASSANKIPNGVTTENKKNLNKKGDPVGQTLAGAEKAAGEIVYDYVRSTGKPVSSVDVYSLLINFTDNEAEVYKLSINFLTSKSTISRGMEVLSVSKALNRVLHILID